MSMQSRVNVEVVFTGFTATLPLNVESALDGQPFIEEIESKLWQVAKKISKDIVAVRATWA